MLCEPRLLTSLYFCVVETAKLGVIDRIVRLTATETRRTAILINQSFNLKIWYTRKLQPFAALMVSFTIKSDDSSVRCCCVVVTTTECPLSLVCKGLV